MAAPASAGCSPIGMAPGATWSSSASARASCAGSKSFPSGKAYSGEPPSGLGTRVAQRGVNPPKGRAMAKTRSKSANAIDLLKEDHSKVKKAFKEFENMDRSDTEACRQLIATVCEDLKVHTTLEEEIFYPAVRAAIEDEDIMNEAAVEHETAKMLIEQLENAGPDDPNYFATFTAH